MNELIIDTPAIDRRVTAKSMPHDCVMLETDHISNSTINHGWIIISEQELDQLVDWRLEQREQAAPEPVRELAGSAA